MSKIKVKSKWKDILFFTFHFSLFVLLAGCSDDEHGSPQLSGEPMRFELGFAGESGLQLRVATDKDFKSTWKTDDQVGLYIVKGSGELRTSGNYVDNLKLVRRSDGTWEYLLPPGKEYYPNDGDKLHFYAYYPYLGNAANAYQIRLAVTIDQTDVEDYNSSDVLYATTANIAKSSNAVQLQFSHSLALVQVEVLPQGDVMIDPDKLEVVLTNVATNISLQLGTNEASPMGPINSIKMHRVEGLVNTYRALVPPQTTAAGTTVTLVQSNSGADFSMVYTGVASQTLAKETVHKYKVTIKGNEYYPATHSGCAGSNIYYDTALGHLTFADTGDASNQDYQGVYFQFGSLYGISPKDDYSTSTVLYPPDGGTTTNMAWNDIPRVNDDNITSTLPHAKQSRDRAYLYEITDGDTGIGDICKWLTQKGWAPAGKKWRMPTSMEFEVKTDYSNWSTGPSSAVNAEGTNTIGSGRTKTDTGTPFFPASGNRDTSTGQLNLVGISGYYWSDSPIGTNGYNMGFHSGVVGPGGNANRAYGLSVRCVRE